MSPWEWWAEFDTKVAESRAIEDRVGGKTGGFSSAEWAKARRMHSEKMKAAQ